MSQPSNNDPRLDQACLLKPSFGAELAHVTTASLREA